MLNARQQRILYVLLGLVLFIWLGALVLFMPQVYAGLLRAQRGQALQPVLAMAQTTPSPTSIYQATWTPTSTPTASPTATPVDTYPPWITWTPTATWTPSPTLLPSVREKLARQRRYRPLFKKIAPDYKLDWRLMMALSYRESGLNPNAIGDDNEIGMMQVLPSTWREFTVGVKVGDPFEPKYNILVAAIYLDYVRGECKTMRADDVEGCMLLAYNWGPNNMRRLYGQNYTWEQAPLTQRRYVDFILREAGYR